MEFMLNIVTLSMETSTVSSPGITSGRSTGEPLKPTSAECRSVEKFITSGFIPSWMVGTEATRRAEMIMMEKVEAKVVLRNCILSNKIDNVTSE